MAAQIDEAAQARHGATRAEEDDVTTAERVIDLETERRKRAAGASEAAGATQSMTDDEARAWLDGLMRSHGERLARYFAFRVRDEDTARDLVIETFYRAWRSRHTFRGEARPSTWLWTIGRRVLAAHYEQKSRRAPEVLTDTLPDVDSSPPPSGEGERRRHALLECLGQLSERIQRTAELVWLLGHSYVEAAEILEDSADSVRMRLKRARAPLQACLSEKGIVGANA